MSEIAGMAIKLSASAAGFRSAMKGAEHDVEHFNEKLKEGVTGMDGLKTALGGLAAAFGAEKAFELFGEQEQAVAKLNAVLKSTGHAAGLSSTELQGLAHELEETTTFADETTIGAEAVLATFTQIRGDQFKEATIAAQNLSAVMGQDLQSSVVQIGKALNDPIKGITALRRVGVSFTADQREMIATLVESGDTIGAQKIILGELETEFGGAAEAIGQTFSGQVTQAKNAVINLAETVGGILAPAIAGLAALTKGAAEWAHEHASAVRVMTGVVIGVVGAIALYKGALLALVIAEKAAAAGRAIMLSLEGPAGWAILAGAAVVAGAAVWAVSESYDKVKDSAEGAMGAAEKAEAARGHARGYGEGEDNEYGTDDGEETKTKKRKVAVKSLGDTIAQTNARLREQLETFGMSSREAEIYKLKMAGATDQQLLLARALGQEIDATEHHKKAMDDLKKTQDEMADAAAKIVEDIRDPFEKLADEMERIDLLEQSGLLNAAQAEKARAKAADATAKEFKPKEQKKPDYGKNYFGEQTQAVERRFTAGFRVNMPEDKFSRTAKATERTAKATEDTAAALAKATNLDTFWF